MKRLLVLIIFLPLWANAQNIYTYAGKGGDGYSGNGGPAMQAVFNEIRNVVTDDTENLYIVDERNHAIRKVDTAGIITTIAGTGYAGYSGDGGPATAAQLNSPLDVAIDTFGNVYIADAGNNVIRMVSNTGIITTIAGTGVAGYNGDNIAATTAQINPYGVALDAAGNMYIADGYNYRIRKVNTGGTITTYGGTGIDGYSGDGSLSILANMHHPVAVRTDKYGDVYFADSLRVRMIRPSGGGTISTVAGDGNPGSTGDDALATYATTEPDAIAVDTFGNLYIADENAQRVREVNTGGYIYTIAGTGTIGFTGDGGNALLADLSDPAGVCVARGGDIFIGDLGNGRVRIITTRVLPIEAVENVEMGKYGNVEIYPNPANDVLNISLTPALSKGEGDVTYSIFSIEGAVMLQGNLQGGSNSIPITSLPAGMYMVRVQFGDAHYDNASAGFTVTRKVVKE